MVLAGTGVFSSRFNPVTLRVHIVVLEGGQIAQ